MRYGKVEALHDGKLSLAAGQIVSVIGPNGAGKSTLLNAIMGTLPTTGHAKGVVRYLGEDISALPIERRVSRGMCLVSEKRELFALITVEDNLVLGAYRRKRAKFPGSTGPCLRSVSATEGAAQAGCRYALRRRASNACSRQGANGKAATTDARRAESRSCAFDREGDFPHHQRASPDGRCDAAQLIEQNARAVLQISDYGYVLEASEFALEGKADDLQHNPQVIETYLGLTKKVA